LLAEQIVEACPPISLLTNIAPKYQQGLTEHVGAKDPPKCLASDQHDGAEGT